jgi:hypothetical protein
MLAGQLQYGYQRGFRVTSRTPETIGDSDLTDFYMPREYPVWTVSGSDSWSQKQNMECAVGRCDCVNLCSNGVL